MPRLQIEDVVRFKDGVSKPNHVYAPTYLHSLFEAAEGNPIMALLYSVEPNIDINISIVIDTRSINANNK